MLFLQMLEEDGKVTSGQHVQQNVLLIGSGTELKSKNSNRQELNLL